MADVLSWVDPDGTVYPLDGTWGPIVQWGLTGHFGPPYRFLEQALPLEHGSQVFDVKAGTSSVSLPWEMALASEALLRAKLDEMSWVFSPLRGRGRLRNTRVDGVVREYPCYLRSGMDALVQGVDNGFAAYAPRGVFVFGGGPFWESSAADVTDLTSATPGLWFPFGFPVRLSDSTLYASSAISNGGHVDAWPLITVEGPSTNVQLINNTTGDSFTCTYDIVAGQSISIDMRTIGNKSVTLLPDGLDLFPYTLGDMFPLKPGVNNIDVRLDGSDSSTHVRFEILKRYLNP